MRAQEVGEKASFLKLRPEREGVKEKKTMRAQEVGEKAIFYEFCPEKEAFLQ